jgi:hypothetical protein
MLQKPLGISVVGGIMGEGRSDANARVGRRGASGSDKVRRQRLAFIPPVVEAAVWRAASESGNRGLLLMLTKYFLRPSQLVGATLHDDQLVVNGFKSPLPVDPNDVAVLRQWLERRRRPNSPQAIRNILRTMRPKVVKILTDGDSDTDWELLVNCGITSLRMLAKEHYAAARGFDERLYSNALHDQFSNPSESLRWLSTETRQRLNGAALEVMEAVRKVQMQLEELD